MVYNRPILDYFYGFPLYYRIENRKKGKTVIISHRIEVGGRLKVNYECKPVGKHTIQSAIAECERTGQGLLEALPQEIMAQCMNEFIGLDGEDAIIRRKSIPDLILGVLLTADKEKMIYETGVIREKSTLMDEERVVKCFLEKFGFVCWRDVVPEFCIDWLAQTSEHHQKTVKRVMSRFQWLQMQAGLLDELSWEDYVPSVITRKQESTRSLVRNHIESTMLTARQCSHVISTIFDHIDDGKVSGIDLAILLKLTLGLDENYIAALDLSDVQAFGGL